ncbi:DUF6354 family protein [Streptomyces sp. NPDC007945]
MDENLATEPLYTALLDALAAVHGPSASLDDYARAAWQALPEAVRSGQ